MNPDAVLFPVMYDMLIAMQRSNHEIIDDIHDRLSDERRRRKKQLYGRHPTGPTTKEI